MSLVALWATKDMGQEGSLSFVTLWVTKDIGLAQAGVGTSGLAGSGAPSAKAGGAMFR